MLPLGRLGTNRRCKFDFQMLFEPSEHNKYSTVYLKHPVTFDVNILFTYVVFMFL